MRLDRLLHAAAATPKTIDPEAFAAFRAGLLKHIALEEKILFPALRQQPGGARFADERRLHVDHGAIALLLVPSPTPELVVEMLSILEPHNRLEEAPGGLYAVCDEVLGCEAEKLLARARSYPDVKVARHNDTAPACRVASEALRISGQQSLRKTP